MQVIDPQAPTIITPPSALALRDTPQTPPRLLVQVRAARKTARLTQTEAGALCHRSLRAWAQAEAGERNLDLAAWELFLLRTGQHPTNTLITQQRAV